jgi:hypothetical protein
MFVKDEENQWRAGTRKIIATGCSTVFTRQFAMFKSQEGDETAPFSAR